MYQKKLRNEDEEPDTEEGNKKKAQAKKCNSPTKDLLISHISQLDCFRMIV